MAIALGRTRPRRGRPANTAREDPAIIRRLKDAIAVGLGWLCLASCQAKAPVIVGSTGGGAPPAHPSESDYRAPPVLTAIVRVPGGRVRLSGHAEPGDQVRLATPAGVAVYAQTGGDGAWSLVMAEPRQPRLLGLSMIRGGRAVQSEGYVVLTPEGTAAELRSGAGALVLDDRGSTPAILAVDYDSKGGAVVSGRASAHAAVDLWVDGARRVRGAAGGDGQFSLPLEEPLSFDDHRLEVVDGARRADVALRLSRAAALSAGPYHATLVRPGTGVRSGTGGWRVDWMTPGGGLQTTLLLAPGGAAP